MSQRESGWVSQNLVFPEPDDPMTQAFSKFGMFLEDVIPNLKEIQAFPHV